ncbi:uncharacterized protein B0H18DRAFT_1013451 [Fomitopsis serialis]|uniref:uncharacterized protein n=1 Tax=Fomitopsis serialis TaxID=139415 RepID=UPI0020072D8F|nr:uncharacterized protein B0H18DRAFT_1039493 [Neoantrodia serialis]XP_047892319.1 uncharacterized protein B0H18DRAFT_1013451 [Neoantrodia serialis]KAH9916056.1 hypothetical protein B0H18DRAFT_1039493 [Neoantrodia serialis]KAH9924088.1 hypothetical protein B0H18DRAFT_1013451 [Neoantrodia serialis]
MPSTWENARVSGAMLLRGGLALSPIIAAYQGTSLIPPGSPSIATQGILAGLAASSLPAFFYVVPMVFGSRPCPSQSPLFLPVTTFVVTTDVFSWVAALVLARQRRTGRSDWLLDTMAKLQLTSSVLLGIGSVIRKYLKVGQIDPSLAWTDKVEWQLLGTTLFHIAGATAVLTRRRWEYKQ